MLEEVRRAMHAAVPGAGERISYQIPTITLDGRSLVYFAGWKHHVSVYPVPDGNPDLDAAMAPYRAVASTLRFPLTQDIPYAPIGRVAGELARRRGD